MHRGAGGIVNGNDVIVNDFDNQTGGYNRQKPLEGKHGTMRDFPNDDLLRLLTDDEVGVRMLALHFLSEGYADHPQVLDSVLAGWDRWGPEAAFPEFPLLSHVPIAASAVDECCRRAAAMVEGRKLTAPHSRCAGKLLEQVVRLPARELQSSYERIGATCRTSKIFFRVDVDWLGRRIAALPLAADHLAEQLERAIEALSHQPDNKDAFLEGLAALEALRFEHPEYLDMGAAIGRAPADNSAHGASFQLAMHSLIQFAQSGAEASLAKLLLDSRESIHSNAVEALVRLGSPLAAAHLLAQFDQADTGAQRWIARGLQRLRADGLAVELARQRATLQNPDLWLMLFVAEVRQIDPESLPRLVAELERVKVFSGALIDALNVYVHVHQAVPGARALQQAFMEYVRYINQELQQKILSPEVRSH